MRLGDFLRRQKSLRTHVIHALPVVVLMPHSRCNCRCVMCDIWKANANKHELSAEDLEPHLEAFRRWRTRWFVLSGGEALMHSNLWTLCSLLKRDDDGVVLSLLSTGLLLRRHAAEVVRHVDEVIVSLDGPAETHDAIRRIPHAFTQLADGVAALREHAPGFRVTGRCVIQRRNFRELPEIIDAARSIGLDRISFLAADVSTDAFNRAEPWSAEQVSDVALDRDQAREFADVVERTLAERAADVRSGFVAESPEQMRRLARYFAALHGDGEHVAPRCNAPWVSTVVEADGTVRPCFFHPPLGNLRDAPLDAVLNAPAAVAFRRGLRVDRDPICRRCVCSLHLPPWKRV